MCAPSVAIMAPQAASHRVLILRCQMFILSEDELDAASATSAIKLDVTAAPNRRRREKRPETLASSSGMHLEVVISCLLCGVKDNVQDLVLCAEKWRWGYKKPSKVAALRMRARSVGIAIECSPGDTTTNTRTRA